MFAPSRFATGLDKPHSADGSSQRQSRIPLAHRTPGWVLKIVPADEPGHPGNDVKNRVMA